MERILCAAIYYNDNIVYAHQPDNIDKGFVVCGYRHQNCCMTMFIQNKGNNSYLNIEKERGFITNKNRFVDRYEGFKIAKQANQILESSSCYSASEAKLFSEDLY